LIVYSAKEGSFLRTEARWTITLVVLLLLQITAVGLSHEANIGINGHGPWDMWNYTRAAGLGFTDCMARRYGRHYKHTRGEWG